MADEMINSYVALDLETTGIGAVIRKDHGDRHGEGDRR